MLPARKTFVVTLFQYLCDVDCRTFMFILEVNTIALHGVAHPYYPNVVVVPPMIEYLGNVDCRTSMSILEVNPFALHGVAHSYYPNVVEVPPMIAEALCDRQDSWMFIYQCPWGTIDWQITWVILVLKPVQELSNSWAIVPQRYVVSTDSMQKSVQVVHAYDHNIKGSITSVDVCRQA